MSSSLSSLVEDLSERLCCDKCTDCTSCLDNMITKDGHVPLGVLSVKKTLIKI